MLFLSQETFFPQNIFLIVKEVLPLNCASLTYVLKPSTNIIKTLPPASTIQRGKKY